MSQCEIQWTSERAGERGVGRSCERQRKAAHKGERTSQLAQVGKNGATGKTSPQIEIFATLSSGKNSKSMRTKHFEVT